mgnify:CR=1 FL=1
MPFTLSPPEVATPISPCVGTCCMGADGLCVGCRRTLAEIARWSGMDDDERRRWIREVQPLRPPPARP